LWYVPVSAVASSLSPCAGAAQQGHVHVNSRRRCSSLRTMLSTQKKQASRCAARDRLDLVHAGAGIQHQSPAGSLTRGAKVSWPMRSSPPS
jgi:hypothetical protein